MTSTNRTRGRRLMAAAALALAGALAVSSCSTGNAGQNDSGSAQGSEAVRALLPASIKDKGVLVVATNPTYPPFASVKADGGFEGFDVDIANMIAKRMGLRLDLQGPAFSGIIPGIDAGHYDLGIAALGDNEERRKTVVFVDYFRSGVQGVTLSQNSGKYSSLLDVCGARVALVGGSQYVQDLPKFVHPVCESAGKDLPQQVILKDQSQANLAVQAGRADVTFMGVPSASLLVSKGNNEWSLVGESFHGQYGGIAAKKGSDLTEATVQALTEAKADGEYEESLKRWGLDPSTVGVKEFEINGDPSDSSAKG